MPEPRSPSFVAALGLPGWGADRETMRRTLTPRSKDWDLRQTWGWDYPMVAMTATRLDEPEKAVDCCSDAKNNKFGRSGMTPRVHLDAERRRAAARHRAQRLTGRAIRARPKPISPPTARCWRPWGDDGGRRHRVHELNPGFPPNGQWIVRSEGVLPTDP